MTLQFPQPEVETPERLANTILFMAQPFATGENGRGLKYEIVLSGFHLEAEITSPEGKRVLRERISIKPLLDAWVTDLLKRAENGTAT
jgi:hypothetical protein